MGKKYRRRSISSQQSPSGSCKSEVIGSPPNFVAVPSGLREGLALIA